MSPKSTHASEINENKVLSPSVISRSIIDFQDVEHFGTLVSDETWSSSDNVHIVACDVIVPTGITLNISAGAIVKFHNDRAIIIEGTLRIIGSSIDPVRLTSFKDDMIGGDTNGDGGNSTPARGDWTRIEFRDNSDDANSLIEYVELSYGGSDFGCCPSYRYGSISLYEASPTIRNTTITESQNYAIRTRNSSPALTCVDMTASNWGIYNETPATVVNGINLYWGSGSGPYHPTTNPSGGGVEVSDGVNYRPWLSRSCNAPTSTGYQLFLPITRR